MADLEINREPSDNKFEFIKANVEPPKKEKTFTVKNLNGFKDLKGGLQDNLPQFSGNFDWAASLNNKEKESSDNIMNIKEIAQNMYKIGPNEYLNPLEYPHSRILVKPVDKDNVVNLIN